MNKLNFTLATLTLGAGLALAQAPEITKPETVSTPVVPELPGMPEISNEFDHGMPADVKAAEQSHESLDKSLETVTGN